MRVYDLQTVSQCFFHYHIPKKYFQTFFSNNPHKKLILQANSIYILHVYICVIH